MPIVPLFDTSQIIGSPNTILIQDVSTGSDVAITSRRVTLTLYDATTIVPSGTTTSYIAWPLATNPISLNVLQKDQSISVLVQWLSVTNTVLYSKTILTVFNMYASMLDDTLITAQQAKPNLVNDTVYYTNRIKLRVAINDAINSITDMSDITNSQQACDRGMYFVDNQSLFF